MHLPSKKQNFLGSRLILVVDDIQLNQVLMKHLVEGWGCKVEIASNGKIALDMLNQNDYDLILMDIQMPVMNGIETTEAIRSWKTEKADIPIIAVTANAAKQDVELYRAIGVNDVIEKPISADLLFDKLSVHLSGSQIESEEGFYDHSNEKPLYSMDLLNSYNVDASFINGVIESLINDIPNYILKLEKYLGEENWLEFKKSAHEVKNGVMYFQMYRVSALTEILEDYANRQPAVLKDTTQKLVKLLLVVQGLLKEELLKRK